MLKKTITVLAACMMLTSVMPAVTVSAYEHMTDYNTPREENDEYSYYITDGGAIIQQYKADEENVVIPNELGGKPVVGIGNYAFCAKSLKSVKFPSTLKSICWNAFSSCTNLTAVEFPDGLEDICSAAFFNTGLRSVKLPDSIKTVGNGAFSKCENLTKVEFSDKITFVGANPFAETPWYLALEEANPVVIVNGILLKARVCDRKSFTVPDGVKAICGGAMWGYEILETVVIPDSVKEIGCGLFVNSPSLKSVTLPKGLTKIPHRTFYGCPKLTSVNIPEGIEEIGYGAFYGCESLPDIKFGDKLKRIYDCAFENCKSFKKVELPDSVVELCALPDQEFIGEAGLGYIHGVFPGCENLEYAKLPLHCTDLGISTFSNCKKLKTIIMPEKFDAIPYQFAFNCESLTSIVIPEGVTSIGMAAFGNCNSLTDVTIPSTLKNGIEQLVFTPWAKEQMKETSFLTVNGKIYAYDPESDKTEVTFPEFAEEVKSSLFYGCPNITSVYLGENVRKIGVTALGCCPKLETVTIMDPDCYIADDGSTISTGYEDSKLVYNGVIRGYSGSTAEDYANKYSYKFETLGDTPAIALGDVNKDGKVNAADASMVLVEYSILSTGGEGSMTRRIAEAADVNSDGNVNASDASKILSYYSYLSTGGTVTDMAEWLKK